MKDRAEAPFRWLYWAFPDFPFFGINHPFFGFLTLGMLGHLPRLGDESLALPPAGCNGQGMFCTVLGGGVSGLSTGVRLLESGLKFIW